MSDALPLAGLRVLDLGHTIMGPRQFQPAHNNPDSFASLYTYHLPI